MTSTGTTIIKLWRDNRIDGEYEMTAEQIVAGFLFSPWGPPDDQPPARRLIQYMSSNKTEGGLHSTWEPADFDTILDVFEAR